jgi:hypothetical protein
MSVFFGGFGFGESCNGMRMCITHNLLLKNYINRQSRYNLSTYLGCIDFTPLQICHPYFIVAESVDNYYELCNPVTLFIL